MTFLLKPLPPNADIETKAVLKKAASAHRYLAELKGVSATIPNESILINTLAMQEAKDSSAVENIITTHDEIFKSELFVDFYSPAAKEVQNYVNALKKGFSIVRKNKILTANHILEIQQELELNKAGFRKLPGTTLKNDLTGEVIYTPPQNHETILQLMQNLEIFMNQEDAFESDPLIKMAIIHHQFESIHPFYDGNGRTGRIINILYLIIKDLLDLSILYLSRFVIRNKSEYYRLLQVVRDEGVWEEWILFMLKGVEETSKETIKLVEGIRDLMQKYKRKLREELPKLYSQDLLNNLFGHPYTKIEFIMEDLRVSRLTAARYLNQLEKKGFVEKQKIGRSNFYINNRLVELLMHAF